MKLRILLLAPLLAACGGERGAPVGALSTGSVGAGQGSGSGGAGAGGAGGAGGGATGSCADPPIDALPVPAGECPSFASDTLTFSIADGKTRDVEVRLSDAASSEDGPLVVVWHAVGEGPLDALDDFGQDQIDAILAQGGVVAAPSSDPDAGFYPWYYTLGGSGADDDLLVLDELLACAVAELGIDVCRIHTTGFAEGAMQAAQVAARRSGYLASVAAHSPSYQNGVEPLDPDNLYPAIVLHGGPFDVTEFDFGSDAPAYAADLVADGHFVVLCDHQGGHLVAEDAKASVTQFLLDHPYGVDPLPYPDELPASYPNYCAIGN